MRIHPEIEAALRDNQPVVALESAVITSGLPREALPGASRLRAIIATGEGAGQNRGLTEWDVDGPVNLELGRAMQRIVRAGGATPATVAVIQGDLMIGLNDDELVLLASEQCAEKASSADLAHIMARGGTAGTTVSATLAACRLTHSALGTRNSELLASIRVFATGGIGGVHRAWQSLPDISADLRAIASTPVCIVCSGAKSILDLPATLEALETLGVPVVGYQTDCFPRFTCPGDASLRLRQRIDDPQCAAHLYRLHWDELGLSTGVILANPAPDEFTLDANEFEAAVAAAEQAAAARGIVGAARTPFLLAELARITSGRSLDGNIALLLNNARLAAEIAVAMANAATDRSHHANSESKC